MDGLLVLLGLIVLAIPVTIIVLLVGQSSLKSRMAALERRVSALDPASAAARLAEPGPVADASPVQAPPTLAPPADTAAPPQAPAASPVPQVNQGAWVAPPARLVSDGPAEAPAEQAPPAPSAPPSGPIVLRSDRAAAFGLWLQRNWIYAVSAASLALAGVFLVQYSVQNGLLPPAARVIAAYLFGAALVAAGEWLRRRKGDGEDSDTAHLPSVFAGAGIVTLFAATVAAQQLYGLIGPNLAFALHGAVAVVAVVLGWYYGALLVAVGLIGAAAAPFLVSSGAGPTPLLYGYYALIAAAGLAVDAIRRWAWVSVLALVLGFGGAFLMMQGGAGQGPWVAFLLALPMLAITLPPLQVVPRHDGPAALETLLANGKLTWPNFPVRLAAGTVLAATLALTVLEGDTALTSLLAMAGLTLLAVTLLIWADRAQGLADLAILPGAALVLRVFFEAANHSPLAQDFMAKAIDLRPPETSAPMSVTWIVVMATLVSAAFAWRALRAGTLPVVHGLGAVLVAPVVVAVLELNWLPSLVLGPAFWALHPMVLAAAMVALAGRFAAMDGADHRRMAHATLSALALIALSLFILTSATALTLALAALIVAAAWLDRRFTLPEMGLFIQIAVAVISYRLLIDPGLDWAMDAPLFGVIVCFAGVIAGEVAACILLKGKGRTMASGVLDSAAMAATAVLANVLLTRWLVPGGYDAAAGGLNYLASLNAMPWLIFALTQVYRAGLGPMLRRTRLVLAALAGLFAGALLLWSAIALNPLFAYSPDDTGARVIGPLVLDTLALSYALPGLVLLAAVWRFGFPRLLRLFLLTAGCALIMLYIGLEIRRFWQGDFLGNPGVTQYELYTYTIAMMLAGAGLLFQSIARRSPTLRRIAMAVITLVIAKVFLIDAAGLTGLTRVFSFLGLGLSLAGLAWLNRWAGQRAEGEGRDGT